MSDNEDGPPLTLKERKQRLELAAAASTSIRSAPTPTPTPNAPPAPPALPVRHLSVSSSVSASSSPSPSLAAAAATVVARPSGTRSPQPQWLPAKRPPTASPSRPDYALVQQYPPLSPTPSSAGSPAKSRTTSPSGEALGRSRAGSAASALSWHSAASSAGAGSATHDRSRPASRLWDPPALDQSTSPTRHGTARSLGRIDTSPRPEYEDDALISFASPILPGARVNADADADRGWGSASGQSPAWRLQPPTPSTPHQRPPSQERSNSHPSPGSAAAPELPPRRRAATFSPEAALDSDLAPPALPPRPRPVQSIPSSSSLTSDPRRPTTSSTTARGRHSRHAPNEFQSVSLSSGDATVLTLSLASPPPLARRPTPTAPSSTPKRRPIDPRSRARYDALFDRMLNALLPIPRPQWVKRDDAHDALDALVVRGVWERSRLDRRTLSNIWCGCDTQRRGSLRKDEFAEGLWRIDEELRKRSRRP